MEWPEAHETLQAVLLRRTGPGQACLMDSVMDGWMDAWGDNTSVKDG